MKQLTVILLALLLFGVYCFYKSSWGTFAIEFFKEPTSVGSLVPTSSFVSEELIKPMLSYKQPLRVLEAGAGTGAVTETIIKSLKANDVLDVIEIDPIFCSILRERFQEFKNVNINCVDLEHWHPKALYDIIISTLPFSNFKVEQVEYLLSIFKKLLATGGTFSYVAYMGVPFVKRFMLSKDDYANFIRKQKILADFRKQGNATMQPVWFNIPPAYVYHLQ